MRNQRIIIAFGELLIPLLGFYWWKWDLHFIFLFYYLDIVASVFVYAIKVRKISLFRTNSWHLQSHLRPILLWYMFLIIGLIAFEIGVLLVYPDINLVESLMQFLKYKEFGVPQGMILIPLVFVMNYQQYEFLFVRTNAYRVLRTDFVQKVATWTFLCFAGAGVVFLIVNLIFSPADYLWLWLIVAGKISFDLWIQPRIEYKYSKTE